MEATIRALHCRYRLVQRDGLPDVSTNAIDHSLREEGLNAWETALEQTLGEEAQVLVLREVQARVAFNLANAPPDALARRWGKQMARAVVNTIVGNPADGDNLMRFENRAHFVACFLAELVRGTAWQRWYYGVFSDYLHMELSQALGHLLSSDPALLGPVLAYLHKDGALNVCLRHLDPSTARDLWGHRVGRQFGERGDSLFLQAALRLAERLGIMTQQLNVEHLQSLYSASSPSVNWSEKAGLSAGVLNALSFLKRQVYLRRPSRQDMQQLAAGLDAALEGFDWLDVPALRFGLIRLLAPAQPGELPARPAPTGPNHRQVQLLEELGALLQSGEVELDPGSLSIPLNSLRWYAALLSHSPEWGEVAWVETTIQQVLNAWTTQSRTIPGLGEPGRVLLSSLQQANPNDPLNEIVETNCAGSFLLPRTLLDLRLPVLAGRLGDHSRDKLPDLLVALSRCWAGLPSDSDDPGLAWIAGIDHLELAETLNGSAAQEFQSAFLQVLLSQRAVTARVMHLYALPWPGGQTAWIAGDPSSGIWPLGQVTRDSVVDKNLLQSWLGSWQPEIMIGDPPFEEQFSSEKHGNDQSLRSEHEAGRAALQAALDALHSGQNESDLFVLLTAAAILRSWARWLRGFSASSLAYLLEKFICRPGRLEISTEVLQVVLEPEPMDLVLEISGYLDPIQELPWLGNRRVEFKIGDRI